MRVLKFIVDKEMLRKDPGCDFTGLLPGKEDEVKIEFAFSYDWENRVKVAAFWSITGSEFPPQVINTDGSCMIPKEALDKVVFQVQVLGKDANNKVVTTNCSSVYQSGTKR